VLQLDEPEDKSQIDRRRCGELANEESDMDGDEPVIVQTDTRAADSGYVTPAPSNAETITPSGINVIFELILHYLSFNFSVNAEFKNSQLREVRRNPRNRLLFVKLSNLCYFMSKLLL
jgi:hypothetical protein